jgi:hypothetical protein
MKCVIFASLIFLCSTLSSNASLTFENLPDEIVLTSIGRHLCHKEIVQALGCVSHRYHDLSQDKLTWNKTVITQPQGKKECKELELFLDEIQKTPTFTIEQLSITGHDFSSGELEQLGKWLFTRDNALISLSFTDCNLHGGSYRNLFLTNFARWLEKNEKLEELNLSGNLLGNKIAGILKVLRKNKGLKKLFLDRTYLTGDLFHDSNEDLLYRAISGAQIPDSIEDLFPKNIIEYFRYNSTLKLFSFRENKMHSSFGVEIFTNIETIFFAKNINLEGTLPAEECVRIKDLINCNKLFPNFASLNLQERTNLMLQRYFKLI